jgi:hypothetical protein
VLRLPRELLDGVAERLDVAGRAQRTVVSVLDELARAAHARRDERCSHRHRRQDRQTEALFVRGQDGHRGLGQQPPEDVVIDPFAKLDFGRQAELLAHPGHPITIGPGPDKTDTRSIRTELAEREQQRVQTLRAFESAEEQRRPGVQPRCRLPDVVQELWRHAVVHGVNAVRRQLVGTPYQIPAEVARRGTDVGRAERGAERRVLAVSGEQSETVRERAAWREQPARETRVPRRHHEPEMVSGSGVTKACRFFTLRVHDRNLACRELAADSAGHRPRGQHPERSAGSALVVEQRGPPQSIGQRRRRSNVVPRRLGEDHRDGMAAMGQRGGQVVRRSLPATAVRGPGRIVAREYDAHGQEPLLSNHTT